MLDASQSSNLIFSFHFLNFVLLIIALVLTLKLGQRILGHNNDGHTPGIMAANGNKRKSFEVLTREKRQREAREDMLKEMEQTKLRNIERATAFAHKSEREFAVSLTPGEIRVSANNKRLQTISWAHFESVAAQHKILRDHRIDIEAIVEGRKEAGGLGNKKEVQAFAKKHSRNPFRLHFALDESAAGFVFINSAYDGRGETDLTSVFKIMGFNRDITNGLLFPKQNSSALFLMELPVLLKVLRLTAWIISEAKTIAATHHGRRPRCSCGPCRLVRGSGITQTIDLTGISADGKYKPLFQLARHTEKVIKAFREEGFSRPNQICIRIVFPKIEDEEENEGVNGRTETHTQSQKQTATLEPSEIETKKVKLFFSKNERIKSHLFFSLSLFGRRVFLSFFNFCFRPV